MIKQASKTPTTLAINCLGSNPSVVHCGAKDAKLPLEKHLQYRHIDMTFGPERICIR